MSSDDPRALDVPGERPVVLADTFPGENPNPVLRVGWDGILEYANRASGPLLDALGGQVGASVPPEIRDRLAAAAAAEDHDFELSTGLQTFAIRSVRVPGRPAWNVYGRDVTGVKVVEKFPDRNPHPVLRIRPDGTLIYSNVASQVITRTLGVAPGDRVPGGLLAQIRARLAGKGPDPIEVAGEGRIFRIDPVRIPEFDFVNLYGTDVTAIRAVTAFPDENPNPVLRADRSGRLVYANPASEPVLAAFAATVGEPLPPTVLERLREVSTGPPPNTFEITFGGQTWALRVVSLRAFESINVYGSDVTAAREVERLLLNILPASIATRLQHGESLIADRFDEMAVLFADVVGFTPFAASRAPSEVVGVLNDVFTIFDRLTDRHGLEKIKTVGDAYMVAGGLTPDSGRVEDVAEMALDMLAAMGDYRTGSGVGLEIRIGLHVGPAVAGVIGLKKFIYDIWGDTVNTASRLESHGVAGRIQVTHETAGRLADRFRFEPRGVVELKGKGPTQTAFLVGRAQR